MFSKRLGFRLSGANQIWVAEELPAGGMSIASAAWKPFEFQTPVFLPEYVGPRAETLTELLEGIRTADDATIQWHTLNFIFEHQCLRGQSPSGFSYWVTVVLQEHELGEKLAAVNPIDMDCDALRRRLVVPSKSTCANTPP